jgi:CheY-like chemotaxis protein
MNRPRQIILALHDRELSAQIAALLEKAEFEVKPYTMAYEVVEAVFAAPPALVILGMLLPDANGLELCKRIKNDPHVTHVKVLIISTFKRAARFAAEARTKFGADAYLEMPFTPAEFRRTIDALFGGEPVTPSSEPRTPRPTPRPMPAEPARPEPPRPTAAPREVAKDEAKAPPSRPAAAPKPEPKRPARPPSSIEVPLAGRLGPVLIPELLLALYQRHANGILEVRAFDEVREILVTDGVPVAIRTNFIPDEALGQMIVARGLLGTLDLERALHDARERGKKIGEVLVERGVLPPHELLAMLKVQAKRKMNAAFKWKEGSYSFQSGPRAMADAIEIEQDLLSLLIAGVVRHYNLAKLEDRLYANKSAIVERVVGPELTAADLRLSQREWQVLDLVDGERTLGEIIAETELNFARTFQVLYLFLLFGLIRFRGGDRFFRVDDAVAYRARAESAGMARRELAEEDEAAAILPDAGDLTKVPFSRYLLHLYQTRATGCLSVSRGPNEEFVYLIEGMPVQVLSNRPGPHSLGHVLVQQGKLTGEQRERALQTAQSIGRPFGETLLNEGLITPHDLFAALLAQLESKLVALFGWREGKYQFEEGLRPEAEFPPMNVDLMKLILRGMQENLVAADAVRHLRDHGETLVVWSGGPHEASTLFADPKEVRFASLIDGKKSVGQLLQRDVLDKNRAAVLLFSLLQLGLVRLHEK